MSPDVPHRQNITVPGIPGIWTTNLSDEDLREFYSIYAGQPATQEFSLSVFTRVITIRIISTAVPFNLDPA